MNWQHQLWLFVLPILMVTTDLLASSRLSNSDEIKRFILFNYDNIIADYYEQSDGYIRQVVHLIHASSGINPSVIQATLFVDATMHESHPVFFMFGLNNQLLETTGYSFVER